MGEALAEKRSALLIGVGKYANSDMLSALSGPQVDVRNMKTVLEHSSIGGYDVHCLEDVDSQTACTRIEEFLGSRSEDETVVLFYSGHGFIDRKGALYLCTTNSSFATPRASSIRADFLTELIDNCASKRVLMLLDCCYSGNFEGAAKATSVIEPQFKGTGLGRVVLTAGAQDQLAWDLGATGSLFSRHVVKGLSTGAADLDQDGRITVQELYDYVYREVTKEQPRQRPGKWTYREDGPSFLIARSPVQPRRELPAELLHELESHFSRTRLAALRELEAFARRHSWARDPVIARLRAALTDDSDTVKAAARELLERMSVDAASGADTIRPSPTPTPDTQASPSGPMASTSWEAKPPPDGRIQFMPSVAPPDARRDVDADADAGTESGDESEFPIKAEVLVWIAIAAVLPQLIIRPFISAWFDEAAVFVSLYATMLVAFSLVAVRYRAVDGVRDLVRRPAFVIAAALMIPITISLLVLD